MKVFRWVSLVCCFINALTGFISVGIFTGSGWLSAGCFLLVWIISEKLAE